MILLLLLCTNVAAQVNFLFEEQGVWIHWQKVKGARFYHLFCYSDPTREHLLYTCTTKENKVFVQNEFFKSTPLYIQLKAYGKEGKIKELSSSSFIHPNFDGEWIKSVRVSTYPIPIKKKKRMHFSQSFSVTALLQQGEESVGYSVQNTISFSLIERICVDANLLYERGEERKVSVGASTRWNLHPLSFFATFQKTLKGDGFFNLCTSFSPIPHFSLLLGYTPSSFYANCNWWREREGANLSFHHAKGQSFIQAGYTISY